MFKLPKLRIFDKHEHLFTGIPRFRYKDLQGKDEIGSGGFGKVIKASHSNETVVVKVFHDSDDDYFIRNMAKEARLLNSLRHQNIADFRSVCLDPPSMMLGFESFSLKPFDIDREFNNLCQYLNFMDRLDDSSFFVSFVPNIVEDIVKGLGYLHAEGIAHRDLKPQNILVSNINYSHLRAESDNPDFDKLFRERPITCKLTDFGESRSEMIQTQTLVKARTRNLARGTNPYLAPEAIVPSLKLKTASFDDLMRIDIWALGMTFFGILNPGVTFPFNPEFQALPKIFGVDRTDQFKSMLIAKLEKGQRPSPSAKYVNLQKTDWIHITKMYQMCTLQTPAARPRVEEIVQMIQKTSSMTSSLKRPTEWQSEELDSSKSRKNETTEKKFKSDSSQKLDSTKDTTEKRGSEDTGILRKDTNNPTTETSIESDDCNQDPKPAEVSKRKCHAGGVPAGHNVFPKNRPRNIFDEFIEDKIGSIKDGNKRQCETAGVDLTASDQEYNNDVSSSSRLMVDSTCESMNACQEENINYVTSSNLMRNFMQANKTAHKAAQSDASLSSHPIVEVEDCTKAGLIQQDEFNSQSTHVAADFHQGSWDIFDHEARGTQCSTISLMAIVAGKIKSSTSWTKHDIHRILIQGDKEHVKQLQKHGWPETRVDAKLDVDELPNLITCRLDHKEERASVGLMENSTYGPTSELFNMIIHAIHNKPNHSFLIRLGDKCQSILKGAGNSYSIFDSHSCNVSGLQDPNGASLLLNFPTKYHLARHLEFLTDGMTDVQHDITPVDLTFLGEDGNAMVGTDLSTGGEDSLAITVGLEIPDYRHNVTKGLGLKEILEICVLENVHKEKICKVVPGCRTDSIFVVDLSAVNEKDLSCDDSGVFQSHSSPTVIVKACIEDGEILDTRTVSRKKVDQSDPILKEPGIFKVKRTYSVTEDAVIGKGTRIICKVYRGNERTKFAIVQYLGNCQSSKPHGNSRNKEQYLRTKASVIEKERKLASNKTPKQVVNSIENDLGDLFAVASPSDMVRNRQQIYNLKRKIVDKVKSRNTGKVPTPDFSKLVASLNNDIFVKNISFMKRDDVIYPNTFAATENTIHWIKEFCSPLATFRSQLGIDMTYKVGPFYTTIFSLAHPMFVYKSDPMKHPTVFGGMMTSTDRKEDDYGYMAGQLRSTGIKTLIYGTDGELALEKGMERVFPIERVDPVSKSIKLRCFSHCKDNLETELKQIGVKNHKRIVNAILGTEFNGKRTAGLVDCESVDFEAKYQEVASTWPEDFQRYMLSRQMRVRSLKETLHLCMGKDVRVAAGLGDPPNKFNNQRAESLNNVFKEALGNRYVDQAAVHDLVYKNVVLPQERELIKAVFCQGEYRLAPSFNKFEVHPLRWKSMTQEQRQLHIRKVIKSIPKDEGSSPTITRHLTIQPEDCKDHLRDLPLRIVHDLWHGAEIILSHSHIKDMAEGSVCIADGKNAYIISRRGADFHCQCEQFRKLKLCSHIFVVADERSELMNVIQRYTHSPSNAIGGHRPKTAGEKHRVKKPRKGSQNVKTRPITEVCEPNDGSNTVDLRVQHGDIELSL